MNHLTSVRKGKRRTIAVVLTSRAHYGRLKAVLREIVRHPKLGLQLIIGASALLDKYGELGHILKRDGFSPDATFHAVVEGEHPITMVKTTALAMIELSTIFDNLKPDMVFVHADRYEIMAPALASGFMNIPLAHNQAGEVTGSIDESVRHAVTKLAQYHFVSNREAAKRVMRMGENPRFVFVTGCPSLDLIKELDLSVPGRLFQRYKGVGPHINLRRPYLLVLQHPVTTEYGSGFWQINQTLQAVWELKIPTVWFWPNVDAGSDEVSKGLRIFRERYQPEFIHFYKNLSPEDYLRLFGNAACALGNSSSFIREGSFLGVPAVIVGTRQQGRQYGRNVKTVGYDAASIKKAVQAQLKHGKYPRETLYGDGKAAPRIARILAEVPLYVQKKITY